MRWKKINYKTGDLKTKEFFAWWPIKIKDEWRWWERVKISYRYQEYYVEKFFFSKCRTDTTGRWEKVDFIDS